MSPTLLITGAAGFIGSNFAQHVLATLPEANIIVLDALTYAGHKENLAEALEQHPTRISFMQGNILDKALVSQLLARHKVTWLVNFAAESHVDNSITGSRVFIETNVLGTHSLLEAAREYWQELPEEEQAAFRYLQISTDEVYGSLGETGKFSETTPYAPNSPYSSSKAGADHLVRAWHETYGLPTLTTHCTNNYGPRQHPEKLIPLMITYAVAGKQLPVYGDGKHVRDWIHVQDHADGILKALLIGNPGEVYGFGGNAERNNLQTVEAICTILDDIKPREDGKSYREQISFVKDRPGHDRRYAIDDSKAAAQLGYSRVHTFESGLKATVEWYLANSAWCKAVAKPK